MDFVNVALRIKPVEKNYMNDENANNSCLKIISKEPPIVLATDRLKTYDFDNIFTEEEDQETVYKECVKPLIKYVKEGYNCTVFAYGQTGTGKTYTIGTDPQVKDQKQLGLIPRTLNEFFEYNQNENLESEILLSFIEIYKEKVFDLLQNDNNQPLLVKGLKAEGFRKEKVFNLGDATHFLDMGNKNRHTAGTKQNSQSSRSHAIFTIYCKVKHSGHETCAKLNLVDLAGCESVKKTGNKGSTFDEGVNINKGLLCIGQVMTALADNSSYVPYRQSIITSILQDSLNKNNFVSLIACVSNCQEDTTETIQTMEFAARVKRVKSRPEVNKVVSQYKKDNPVLFQNARTCGTPFKRPQTPMRTPAKYSRTVLMPLLSNAEQSSSSVVSDQSSSLKSFGTSGVSRLSTLSGASDVQQTLSPVIQKYIGKMEDSIMKMEDSLMKKMEDSLVKKMEAIVKSTPYANWSTLQNEMRKMRTEIAQISTRCRKKATSSPIEDRMSKAKKVLSYGTPTNNSPDSEDSKEQVADSFKVPGQPIDRKRNNENARHTLSISPIEPDQPRRSVRLSMKRIHEDCEPVDVTHEAKRRRVSSSTDVSSANSRLMTSKAEVSKNISSASVCHAPVRRSVRLALKKTGKEESLEEDDLTLQSSYLRIGVTSVLESTLKQEDVGKESGYTRKKKNETRKDGNKNLVLNVKATPAGTRLLKKHKNDSPYTAHTKQVFTKLTKGGQKDLEKLHYVGTKTAEQILSFRKLRGPIKKISDLKEIFGPKKFDTFVKKNFLKIELL